MQVAVQQSAPVWQGRPVPLLQRQFMGMLAKHVPQHSWEPEGHGLPAPAQSGSCAQNPPEHVNEPLQSLSVQHSGMVVHAAPPVPQFLRLVPGLQQSRSVQHP